MNPAVRSLLQPVRLAVVCRHLGQLALVLALLVAVPTGFAYGSGDWDLGHRLLLAALLPSLALGACALIPGPARPIQANEALVVSALAFVVAAALLTFPLTAAGLPLLDAWFESVSGVTTTGQTMVPDPQDRTDAFLLSRAWMQWFGGLGIVVLSLALAASRRADQRRLSDAAGEEESLDQGVRLHARRVLAVYPSWSPGTRPWMPSSRSVPPSGPWASRWASRVPTWSPGSSSCSAWTCCWAASRSWPSW